MVNKSGVSAVVATVLIVMITVAAVGLLWAIVSPFLKSNIADKAACVDAEISLSIDSGSAYTCVDSSNGTAVRVSRGSDDNDWRAVQVIYTDSAGNSEKYDYAYPPERNSEKVYRNVDVIDVTSISVLPVLSGDGDDLVCSKTVDLPSVKSCSSEVAASITETSLDYIICNSSTVNFHDANALCLTDLISYWNFNNDDNVIVNDLGDNVGTYVGTAYSLDGVLELDGVSGYVTTPFVIDNYVNFSWSVWIKPASFRSYNYIWDGSPGTAGCGARVNVAGGVEFYCYAGDGGANLATDTGLLVDVWYHYVFIQSDVGSRVYRDGILRSSNVQDDSLGILTGSAMYIGAEMNGNNKFNGSIDDFVIFDRVLTESEISDIYQMGR